MKKIVVQEGGARLDAYLHQQLPDLSRTMIQIGRLANKETVCVRTNIDLPIGKMVGNTLEVIEAIEALKGNMHEDVKSVVLELGAYILKLDGKGNDVEENKKKIEEAIRTGKAYSKFIELVDNQGGDISYIKDISKFEKSKYKLPVRVTKDGYIKSLNAEEVGKIASFLGAGRIRKEDNIDYSVGIELLKKVGDEVEKNEIVAYIYANNEQKGEKARNLLIDTYKISEETVEKVKDILEIVE